MISKSNIVLVILGAFLSAQFLFFKSIIFFMPFYHWHHHKHWLNNSLGFTSLVGMILIFLGIYNIYKENRVNKKC
jgi:hypothetical protein